MIKIFYYICKVRTLLDRNSFVTMKQKNKTADFLDFPGWPSRKVVRYEKSLPATRKLSEVLGSTTIV